MYPQTHFLFSFLVGLIFVKSGVFDWKIALLIGLVGLFVDVDHYIIFLFKYKRRDFSLKDAWNRAVNGIYAGRSFIHHNLGIFLFTAVFIWLFIFYRNIFWIFSLGYYSHIFLDYAHLNILRIKERMTFKEDGFVMKINKFELLLDIFLITGIVLLLL